MASSSVLASLQKFRNLHVIWIDAHPDIHTYSSTVSGNTHGTPLSVCTGIEKTHWASRLSLKKLEFPNLIYVGIRDIDDFERETIDKNNIKHWDVQTTVDWLRNNRHLPIHISFDIDALDPVYISSTGTRVEEGMHPHEVREIIMDSMVEDQLKSLDVVEFNPELGDPTKSAHHVREVFKDFFPDEFAPQK